MAETGGRELARVLAILLDGYENTLGETFMSSGEMPALARLRDESARFLLDHGSAKLTGLASEHVSTGLSPQDAGRWSAVHFDPDSYRVWQEGTELAPFPSKMKAKTVVFDLPYFDLTRAPMVKGFTPWGAHDAGVEPAANPEDFADEISRKFGPYPATDWIYGFAWPSPERCRAMGDGLTQGVRLRAEIARWMLGQRFPDWELGMIGVSEPHSALEALWHGIDEDHPLHNIPSAPAAGEGIRNVYRAIDRLIEDLASAFEDATLVVFAMHGMGPNQSDVASMVLLPELLHRTFSDGRPFFKQPDNWSGAPGGIPILDQSETWHVETPRVNFVGDAKPFEPESPGDRHMAAGVREEGLDWMPAARYRPLWHTMPAFALPSFYDGRIRINLKGREQNGLVPLDQYKPLCLRIAKLLKDCRNPLSGGGIVDSMDFNCFDDPLSLPPSQVDITVIWKGAALAFDHPKLGRIGPVPYRRTGGHSGPSGMAYIKGDGILSGDRGMRSSFDVVPTLFDLLGEEFPDKISGRSLLDPDSGSPDSQRAPLSAD